MALHYGNFLSHRNISQEKYRSNMVIEIICHSIVQLNDEMAKLVFD